MVIFHGYVSHNQMVIMPISISWALNQGSANLLEATADGEKAEKGTKKKKAKRRD